MRKLPLFALFAFVVPALAVAQPPPRRPGLPQPPVPVPAPADVTTSQPVPIPPPPDVNDPMLTPVPPAARVIATWDEALQLLKARSTDLRTAVDEVLKAEGVTRTALAAALPTLNATGTYTRNLHFENTQPTTQTIAGFTITTPSVQVPSKVDFVSGSITAVQPLFNLANWDEIGITRRSQIAARLSVEDLKRTLALGVANAIVGVITAERVAELNRSGFRQTLERWDLTRRKKDLGAANGLDVVRAQQDVETARATLVTGDESLRQAREALGLALGLPEQIGIAPNVNIETLEQNAVRSCKLADSIETRADIVAAKERLYIAKRNVRNIDLQFAPTVNAQSTLAASTFSNFPPTTTWNLQAILSVPIFDGGVKYGNLRVARANEDEALQTLEAARRTALVQLEQARRGVGVAEASRKVALDARALAAETDRLTQIAFREGQGTSLELVIAAAALRQADINLTLQDFGLVKARILAILSLASCPW